MRILIALLLLATMPQVVHAQGVQSHGIKLAPGEVLVSVNGVAVQGGPTSQQASTKHARQQASTKHVSLAQSKANRMASSRTLRHLGGGFGGGRFEGVGMGRTREAAIRNCCYWGQRMPIDIGAAQNGNRWYACVIYR